LSRSAAIGDLAVTGNSPRKPAPPSASTYYDQLGLHPSASERDIRRAYRELSKRYHPDTTTLPISIATQKFQALNEAYATLSNYERRSLYDAQIRYSRVFVVQVPIDRSRRSGDGGSIPNDSPGFIDPVDRPLSSGELFALLLMGSTILGCLALAVAIAVLRGDPW
jgi:curved DNA-binding protein CbpA